MRLSHISSRGVKTSGSLVGSAGSPRLRTQPRSSSNSSVTKCYPPDWFFGIYPCRRSSYSRRPREISHYGDLAPNAAQQSYVTSMYILTLFCICAVSLGNGAWPASRGISGRQGCFPWARPFASLNWFVVGSACHVGATEISPFPDTTIQDRTLTPLIHEVAENDPTRSRTYHGPCHGVDGMALHAKMRNSLTSALQSTAYATNERDAPGMTYDLHDNRPPEPRCHGQLAKDRTVPRFSTTRSLFQSPVQCDNRTTDAGV